MVKLGTRTIFQVIAGGVKNNNGNVGIGTTSPNNKLDVITGLSGTYGNYAQIRTSGGVGLQGGLLITNAPGATAGRSSLKISSSWNAGSARATIGFVDNTAAETYLNGGPGLEFQYDGDIILAQSSGRVGIGTTSPGRILECKSGGGNPRADGWDIWSSREFKKDISYLSQKDYSQILAKLGDIKVAHYHFKSEPEGAKLRLGLIAEEAPEEIVSEDRKSTSLSNAIGFLLAIAKAQQKEMKAQQEAIKAQQKEIEELKARIRD